MNVLSLFDGMSCGQVALNNIGIKPSKYYASEIDDHAIKVTQENFPFTIQVGDICKLERSDIPEDIDLLLAGSPCQGFSFAGKQLNFDDERSALFFEFVRILETFKPKYFLLENVPMKRQYEDVITEMVQVEPIKINASLVSAQSRKRLYWTNIPNLEQPKDRGILLKDILEDLPLATPQKHTQRNARHYKGGEDKSLCMTATMWRGAGNNGMTLVKQDKPIQVATAVEKVRVRKHEIDLQKLQAFILEHWKKSRKSKKRVAKELGDKYSTVEHYFRPLGNKYFAIPSDAHWPKLKQILNIQDDTWDAKIMEFDIKDGVYESTQRVYSEHGKSPTLTTHDSEKMIAIDQEFEGMTTEGKAFCLTTTYEAARPKRSKERHEKTMIPVKDPSKVPHGTKHVYDKNDRSYTTAIVVGHASDINGYDILKRVYSENGKSPTLNTMGGGNREPKVEIKGAAMRGRAYDENGKRLDRNGKSIAGLADQIVEKREDGKSNCITTMNAKDNLVADEFFYRKLTPIECERLMGVKDNYTAAVSTTQRFRMLGNGWSVPVIEHIFKNMKDLPKPKKLGVPKQLGMYI